VSDLATLRSWAAVKGRKLELSGAGGKAGVALRDGARVAAYASVSTAALAVVSALVPWRSAAGAEGSGRAARGEKARRAPRKRRNECGNHEF
jgi:hypothetical protein